MKKKWIYFLVLFGLIASYTSVAAFSKKTINAVTVVDTEAGTDLSATGDIAELVEITDNPRVLIYSITVGGTSSAAFLQVFDADSDDVTIGSTTPDYVIPVPSGVTVVWGIHETPVHNTVGYTIASTTTRTGSTPATASVLTTFVSRP